jgi:hypothetical protein
MRSSLDEINQGNQFKYNDLMSQNKFGKERFIRLTHETLEWFKCLMREVSTMRQISVISILSQALNQVGFEE